MRISRPSWTTAAIAVYLALSFVHIDYPVPTLGETEGAVLAMDLLKGRGPGELENGRFAQIGPIRVLLMGGLYGGPLHVYLLMPVFAVFGMSVRSMRSLPIVFGLATLILVFGFCRRALGTGTAAASTALLATHSGYVYYTSKIGLHAENILALFSSAALWSLEKWRVGRKDHWAAAAGLFLGLGLWSKIVYVWVLAGAGAAAWLFRRELPKDFPWRRFWAGSLVGMAPFLAYLVWYRLELVGHLMSRFFHPTDSGVDNVAFLPNLLTRLAQAAQLLAGRIGPGHAEVWAWPAAASALFAWAVASGARDPDRRRGRWVVSLGVVTVVIIAGTSLTPSGLYPTHLAVLFPFTWITLGYLAEVSWTKAAGRAAGRVAVFGVASAVVLLGSADILRLYARLTREGWKLEDTPVCRLAERLRREGETAVVLDWEDRMLLRLFAYDHVFPAGKPTYSEEELEAILWNPRAPVIVTQGEFTPSLDRSSRHFLELLRRSEPSVAERLPFRDSDGRSVYEYLRFGGGKPPRAPPSAALRAGCPRPAPSVV